MIRSIATKISERSRQAIVRTESSDEGDDPAANCMAFGA